MSREYRPGACRLIPPKGGWESHTWYLVEVMYNKQNPVHLSLFYSGFCDPKNPGGRPDGNPGNYNGLVPLNGPDRDDSPAYWWNVIYLKVIKKLVSRKEAEFAWEESAHKPSCDPIGAYKCDCGAKG